MGVTDRRSLAVLLLVGSLGLACQRAVAPGDDIDLARLQDYVQKVAAVRGLPSRWPARGEVVTAAEAEEIYDAVIEETYPEETRDRVGEMLEIVGLWPPGYEVHEELTRSPAGFYIWSNRTLYIVRDESLLGLRDLRAYLVGDEFLDEVVIAHEIVHFLQHQSYPELIETRAEMLVQQLDLATSISTAVEGDATRYGLETPDWVETLPSVVRYSEYERALSLPSRDSAIADAPAYARALTFFRYASGYELALIEGPSLVESPPISTEQILHHQTRRGEPFDAIDLSLLHAELPPDCELVMENGMGELRMSILFRQHGDAIPADDWEAIDPGRHLVYEHMGRPRGGVGELVPERIWEGWNGDRFLTARCDGRGEFLWLTSWDTPADADEFAYAYGLIADSVRENADLGPISVFVEGEDVVVHTEALETLASYAGLFARRTCVSTLAELGAHLGLSLSRTPKRPVPASGHSPAVGQRVD